MPKNIEDMIPNNRRSIRDIPIPKKRNQPTIERIKVSEPEPLPRVNEKPPKEHRYRQGSGRKGVWIGSIVAIVVIVFAVLTFFQSATLAYTPKVSDLSFNGDAYSAHKTGDGALLFSVVKLSGNKGIAVTATGEEQVSIKSSGTISVFNKTTAAQKLIANTRFETPDGKIYRIMNPITVPAAKTVSGGVQPGSVDAVVYADQPGPNYNIGLTDFTIPGFKGTTKFDSVYARSKTPMAGGFVGKQKKISPETLTSAKTNLQVSLKQDLIAQAQSQVPQDFILFPALSNITYDDLPQTNQTDSGATVNLQGNFYGVMFKKSDFAKYIASKKLDLSDTDQVNFSTYDGITLAFAGSAPADLLQADTINFTISGPAKLVWITDEKALSSDLAGKTKKDVPSVLKNYPGIDTASATLRPFWKTSFPTDASKIQIKEKAQ